MNTGWLFTFSNIDFGSFLTKKVTDCSFKYVIVAQVHMAQNKLGICKQNSDTLAGATKGTFTHHFQIKMENILFILVINLN